jgi:hypothetical protein
VSGMSRTSPSRLSDPSFLSALGLVGGFAAARYTGRRELGGVVFAAAGATSGLEWSRRIGPAPATALAVLYTAAMGGSHPLAKKGRSLAGRSAGHDRDGAGVRWSPAPGAVMSPASSAGEKR